MNSKLLLIRLAWMLCAVLLLVSMPGPSAAKKKKHKIKLPNDAHEYVLPSQCAEDKKPEKEFWKGVSKGRRLAEKLWKKKKADCDYVDPFTDSLMVELDKLELRKGSSPKLPKQCKYTGELEGVFAVLTAVEVECADECLTDGDIVGVLAAKAYCDLVIGTDGDIDVEDWIRGAINFCGFHFETACDTTFWTETSIYENADGSCAPYTNGEYFETWELSRLQSCDYPEEPMNYSRWTTPDELLPMNYSR